MPKTAVGLFENPALAGRIVSEIEALGFPRQDVRTLQEPASFNATGVMSFPRVDFEIDVIRELSRMGAAPFETRTYLEGLRRGGALIFATGSEQKVDAAADIMNRRGALEVEEVIGSEPRLPHVVHHGMTPVRDIPVQAGRVRQPGGCGAVFFRW